MEGLIKGLIDVVIGNDRDDDRNDNNDSSDLDQRSRSTWAQVASGEETQEGGPHDYRRDHPRKRQNFRNKCLGYESIWISLRELNKNDESFGRNDEERESFGNRPLRWPRVEEGSGQNNDWETIESRPSTKHHVEEGTGSNNDGWETVGKRPPSRPHEVSMNHWHGYKRPPSEQEYSAEVDYGVYIEPSEEELANLSKACDKLWDLDSNRLVPGNDYQIDCGEGKKVYQKEDMARGSLFSCLSDDVFRRPTFSRFCSLLDNYNPHEGCKEVVTSQERQEQAAFIEEISRTAPIKYLHKYLVCKGIAPRDTEDFKKMLTDIWFDLYSRGGTSSSSSAFEHVFVGEIKQRGEHEVSGFHNWIQPDSETQLLTIQFEWDGVLKSVSTTLVGVSPEFEIALYTLCFYSGEEDNHIQLGPYPVNIKCYRLGRDKIGSVFPIAEC
ncbi:hypothetical protein ACLOJK_030401 [Asimina triloba]